MKNFSRSCYDGKVTWIAPAGVCKSKNVHFRARCKASRESFGNGTLAIAAESFYALYVNGTFVANGPARGTYTCNFVDTHDISHLLRDGDNSIAVEVFCDNYPTFIASPVEPAVFVQVGDVITDELWQVQISADWRVDVPKYTFQIGSMEWRDISAEPLGWQSFADDSQWQQASLINSDSPIYSKCLYMRDVCRLKSTKIFPVALPIVAKTSSEFDCPPDELSEFISKEQFEDVFAELKLEGLLDTKPVTIQPDEGGRGVAIVLDFGQAIIGELNLDITSPAGAVLDVSYDEVIEDGKIMPARICYKFADRYILGHGRQVVNNPLHYRGGRYVQLVFRNFNQPLTINSVTFIDRRYPIEQPAEFSCSDKTLNIIWQKSLATMSACATDTFLDCPWREMSFWVNDFVVQQEFWQQLIGKNDLVARSFSLALSQQVTDGLIPGVCPFDGNEALVLFPTNLFLAMILRDYSHYTGDDKYVDSVLAEVEKIFNICNRYSDDDGLLVPPKLYWNFTDWSYWLCKDNELMEDGKFDVNGKSVCIVNWFNCLAADALAELYETRDETKAHKYAHMAKNTAKAIVEKFWDEKLGCFRELPNKAAPASKITHSLALLSGRLPEELVTPCVKALSRDDCLMPELYMMHYVFKALAKSGDHKTIMELIRKYWQPIAESDCPTIWEANVHEHGKTAFSNSGSMCHAFSLAPVSILQQEILGIKPVEKGFSKFKVTPHSYGAKNASGKINTPFGQINISWNKSGNSLNVKLVVPVGATAICPDGTELSSGTHEFIVAEA